jgi:hypothetical protein
MNKDKRRAGLIWITILALFFGMVLPAFALADIGDNGGTTTLKSDIEMMQGIPIHGGGHVTWRVTGNAAKELRSAILAKYDLPHGSEPPNGQLELDEVKRYINELERYLEGHEEGVEHQFHGAKLRSFSLLNQDVATDVKGLIGTSESSNAAIEIRFYFDAWMPTGSTDISFSETVIPDAIYFPVGENYTGTYKVEHTNYMVSIASYSNVNIDKGSFFLIRTPFGDIYHYSATFKAGEDTGEGITYEEFSWIECPLILFIVVAIFGYFIATMPGRFRRYDVMRNVKLHTLAKLFLIILLLLYFFAGIGSFYVGGAVLWILCVVFLFVSLVVSKVVYEHAERITSLPPKPEAKEEVEEEAVEEPVEKRKEVQCSTCGEIYPLKEGFSLAASPCTACGSVGAVELGSGDNLPPPPPPPK